MTQERNFRILIATGVFWPAVGGPAQQAELYRQAFAQSGHAVRIVTYGTDEAQRDDPTTSYLDAGVPSGMVPKLSRHFRVLLQIWRVFAEFRPDAVHMQTASGTLPVLIGLVARLKGVPAWVKIANDPEIDLSGHMGLAAAALTRPSGLARGHFATRALAKVVMKVYPAVWVTTPVLADRMVQRWGVNRDRLYIESNRFDLDRLDKIALARQLRPRSSNTSLLIISRLEHIKGIDVAIRALSLLDNQITLRIIGDGTASYRAMLHDLAKRLGVERQICWVGGVPPADLPDHLKDADILLVPSRFEAFGNVIVEGMAAGVPVVATDVGGIPYVTQNARCATLVAPESPEQLASAVTTLLEDAVARRNQVLNGRERAKAFSITAGVDRWINQIKACALT